MVSSEPLFKFNSGWPPIRRYRKEGEQSSSKSKAEIAAPESTLPNLLNQETNPEPESVPEPVARPASSSSVTSSVPLMHPYPVALPTPIRDPAISAPFPLASSFNPSIRAVIEHITASTPSPPPSRNQSPHSFQFGATQNLIFPLNNSNSVSGLPQSMGQLPLQSFSSWQTSPQITTFSQPLMGGTRNSPVNTQVGDFPPLYSLPPTFWDPVVRLPEATPVPPTSAPPTPSLHQLASREDGRGENFTDEMLKEIILKAQTHHTHESIAHLTRAQLVKHVDDLVAWWKTANPQASGVIPHPQQSTASLLSPSPSSSFAPYPSGAQHPSQHSSQHTSQQIAATPPSQPQQIKQVVQAPLATPPPSPTRSQEKVIGQCPCCCDATQNAAFAPCGHLYACTTCAHRLYDSGRGKCPVCRIPIQTYLKIYPTS